MEYMEEYGFDSSRASLAEKEGNLAEAARSRLAEGDVFAAIQLYIRDHQHPESISKAVECLLEYLWRRMSYGISRQGADVITKDEATCKTVLELIDKLRDLCTSRDDCDEVRVIMIRRLSSHTTPRRWACSRRSSTTTSLS